MSPATASATLATRAKRLTALARAKKQDEKEWQDLGQLQTAMNKLAQELETLRGVLSAYKRLEHEGVPVGETPDLAEAQQKLESQIATVGRPTTQFLVARTRDVTKARSAIHDENTRAWHEWATQRLGELPTTLLHRVPFYKREGTTRRLASLKKLATGTPDVANIIEFRQAYDLVKEDLDSVEVATADRVLERFESGRIRLADLSDTELEMLREDESLSDQLYLHLTP